MKHLYKNAIEERIGQKSVFGSSLDRVILYRSGYNFRTSFVVNFCFISVPKSQISVFYQ